MCTGNGHLDRGLQVEIGEGNGWSLVASRIPVDRVLPGERSDVVVRERWAALTAVGTLHVEMHEWVHHDAIGFAVARHRHEANASWRATLLDLRDLVVLAGCHPRRSSYVPTKMRSRQSAR